MGNLHDLDVDAVLKAAVDIEPLALQEEYTRLPADLAYWNERYAAALRAHLRSKIEQDKTEARIYIETRERLESEGNGKGRVTVKDVEVAVATNEELLAVRERAVLAEVEKVRVHGVVSAIAAKKDMLVSLGAHVRQEMEGDPVVRAAHAGYRAQQGSKG